MSMDLVKSRIAQGLKSLRLEANYTQEYIAEVLGKGDYSAYYRLEAGKTELKFDDAYKLSQLYEVPMEQIYDPELKKVKRVDEPYEQYKPSNSLQMNVTLDGKESTLKKQVELLTKVNALLA
mgnify:CR=1 FL=1